MFRTFAIFGAFVGLAVFTIAVAGGSRFQLEARNARVPNEGCHLQEVSLDEGYGVSRKVVQRVCAAD